MTQEEGIATLDRSSRRRKRKRLLKLTLEAMSRARNLLSEGLQDEEEIRKIGLIRRAYFDVEFSIGLGRFLVKNSKTKIGKLRYVVVSKKNNPLLMPIDLLKERFNAIIIDLEFAGYDFETAPSERGLESARKARDELKMLILVPRKRLLKESQTKRCEELEDFLKMKMSRKPARNSFASRRSYYFSFDSSFASSFSSISCSGRFTNFSAPSSLNSLNSFLRPRL